MQKKLQSLIKRIIARHTGNYQGYEDTFHTLGDLATIVFMNDEEQKTIRYQISSGVKSVRSK